MLFGVLAFAVLTCLLQIVSCTCIGRYNPNYGSSYGYNQFNPSIAPATVPASSLAASSGGGFPVTSTSPIVPTGLSVLSENLAIDGGVAVGGQLPFLGTVTMDGLFPTAGAGIISYGCGDSVVGILSDSPVPPGAVTTPKTSIAPKTTLPSAFGNRGFKPFGLY